MALLELPSLWTVETVADHETKSFDWISHQNEKYSSSSKWDPKITQDDVRSRVRLDEEITWLYTPIVEEH